MEKKLTAEELELYNELVRNGSVSMVDNPHVETLSDFVRNMRLKYGVKTFFELLPDVEKR